MWPLLYLFQAVYLMIDPSMEELVEKAEQKAHEVFSMVDADDDGFMSEDEFVSACMSGRKTLTNSWLAAAIWTVNDKMYSCNDTWIILIRDLFISWNIYSLTN